MVSSTRTRSRSPSKGIGFGEPRGRDLLVSCLPSVNASSASSSSCLHVHTVVFKKYFEGHAFEYHLQMAESQADDHIPKIEFFGDSLDAWERLAHMVYAHNGAWHEKPVKNGVVDDDEPTDFELYLASMDINDIFKTVPLIHKYKCRRLRALVERALGRGSFRFFDGRGWRSWDSYTRQWEPAWTVARAELLCSAQMHAAVRSWFKSMLVPCSTTTSFFITSSHHEVLAAALHGIGHMLKRIRDEEARLIEDRRPEEGAESDSDEFDMEEIWDSWVEDNSRSGSEDGSLGCNTSAAIKGTLRCVKDSMSKFHGSTTCMKAFRQMLKVMPECFKSVLNKGVLNRAAGEQGEELTQNDVPRQSD